MAEIPTMYVKVDMDPRSVERFEKAAERVRELSLQLSEASDELRAATRGVEFVITKDTKARVE